MTVHCSSARGSNGGNEADPWLRVSSPTSQLHNVCRGLNNDYIQWVRIEPFEHDFLTAKAHNDVYLWQSIQLFFFFSNRGKYSTLLIRIQPLQKIKKKCY